MQRATPSRILVFVPSMLLVARRAVRFMPFSACKLPFGTTKLELVTSGRSVWISLWASGQYSAAEASTIPRPSTASKSATTNVDRSVTALRWVQNQASRQGAQRRGRRLSEVALAQDDRCFAGVAARTAGGHAGRRPELALAGGDRGWVAAAAAERAGFRGRMR